MRINNATPVNQNLQNKQNNKNTAFKGFSSNLKSYFTDELVKLKRDGTMSRNLFILNAFVFLLGSRLITSRDNDEKREILVRDVPTIVIAVQGVPFIGNKIANFIQKRTGFAIMKDADESIITKLFKKDNKIEKQTSKKLKKEVRSYGELENFYTYDINLNKSSGLEGFSKRLLAAGEGVKLKDIYSTLNEKIKNALANFEGNNEDLINKLKGDKSLSEKIIEALSQEENIALKKAESLKTISSVTGFATTLTLLGLCIPKLNIFITEKINKGKKAQVEAKSKNSNLSIPISNANNQVTQNFSTNETKKAFKDFAIK